MEQGTVPVAVILSPPELVIAPGGPPVEVAATVYNMGSDVDQYSIAIEGLPPEWWSAQVSAVALFPGDSIPLAISIHPPADGSAQLGRYPFTVRAYSNTEPTLAATATGALHIGTPSAPGHFRLELAPKRVTAHRGKYRVMLANGTAQPLQVRIGARDESSALNYTLPNPDVVVPANGRVAVPLAVKPKQPQMVGGQNRRFRFTVGGWPANGGNVKEDSAEFIHTPRFPIWLLATLGVLAVLLPLAGFVLWRSLAENNTVTPVVVGQTTPTSVPTTQALLPTITTTTIIAGIPTETPRTTGSLVTPTPEPEECKLSVMEHRGSRDTRFPPGLAGQQPYEFGGKTYQYKSEYISTLFVDQTGVISDVNVGRVDVFRVPYDRNDALAGTLISPSGTKVQLFNWGCGAGTGGGSDVGMHITLDDDAEADVPYSCTENFSGVFKPSPGRLARVNGEEAKGNWILQMDRYSDDENPVLFFNKWELEVCTTR